MLAALPVQLRQLLHYTPFLQHTAILALCVQSTASFPGLMIPFQDVRHEHVVYMCIMYFDGHGDIGMDLSPALCSHFLDICREALGNVVLSVREQRGRWEAVSASPPKPLPA